MNHDLARRAVKCKGWRWMPGMLTEGDNRVISVDDEATCWAESNDYLRYSLDEPAWVREKFAAELPDLDDPATKGCLLALVREAYGDQGLHINRSDPRTTWGLYSYDYDWVKGYVHNCKTEADALVSFLEALDTAPR